MLPETPALGPACQVSGAIPTWSRAGLTLLCLQRLALPQQGHREAQGTGTGLPTNPQLGLEVSGNPRNQEHLFISQVGPSGLGHAHTLLPQDLMGDNEPILQMWEQRLRDDLTESAGVEPGYES